MMTVGAPVVAAVSLGTVVSPGSVVEALVSPDAVVGDNVVAPGTDWDAVVVAPVAGGSRKIRYKATMVAMVTMAIIKYIPIRLRP